MDCPIAKSDSLNTLLTPSLYAASQPQLDRPRLVKRGSTWIQIGWEPLDCDGGYPLRNYFVEYRAGTVYTSLGDTTSLNYTIRDLSPGTEYEFRVGRESTGDSDISYSEQAFIFTLDAGTYKYSKSLSRFLSISILPVLLRIHSLPC